MEILTYFGTDFSAMWCMFTSDDKIASTFQYDSSTMPAMSLMDLRRSSCTSRRIISTFSAVELVEGRPDLLSSFTDVLPLLKCACHSKHIGRLMGSLPYVNHVRNLICRFSEFIAEFDVPSLL